MGKATFSIINIGCLNRNKFWNETVDQRSMEEVSATCTLIELDGRRLLVDPSPYPNILGGLLKARTGLEPDEVEMVFLTHGHTDHCYGIELYPEAKVMMFAEGLEEWKSNPEWISGTTADLGGNIADLVERIVRAEDELPEGFDLIPTPGHTEKHCSLGVDTDWGQMVVAGDAAMTIDFFDAEEGFYNSIDFDKASESIRQIKERADLVVPGHGNYFLNSRAGKD